MSAMSDLHQEIREAIEDGIMTTREIADRFNVSELEVDLIAEELENANLAHYADDSSDIDDDIDLGDFGDLMSDDQDFDSFWD